MEEDGTTDYGEPLHTYSNLAYAVPGTSPEMCICVTDGYLNVVPIGVEVAAFNCGVAGAEVLQQVGKNIQDTDWCPVWFNKPSGTYCFEDNTGQLIVGGPNEY
jgi:hypothetical protein